MFLPFEPETLSELQFRFPLALNQVWNPKTADIDRPGLHRENVFDFQGGLRLIISKDMLRGDANAAEIHVSASWQKGAEFPPLSIDDMCEVVQKQYTELGGKEELRFLGFSKGSVPHWIAYAPYRSTTEYRPYERTYGGVEPKSSTEK